MAVAFILLPLLPVISGSVALQRVPMLKEPPAFLWFSVAEPTQNLTLPCSTTEQWPNLKYSWRKNGKALDLKVLPNIIRNEFDGTVVFLKPFVDHIGWYQCFAKSTHGVASSGIIIVKEMFLQRPKVTFKKHDTVTAPAKLDCPVIGDPSPKYKWKSKTEDCELYQDLVEPNVVEDGCLWLDDVRNNVTYACYVSSPAVDGQELMVEHQLEVKRGTNDSLNELYSSKTVRANLGSNAKMFCIFNGSHKMRTHWSKDGVRLNGSPWISTLGDYGRQLLIRRVRPEDQGIYSCVVDNGDGRKRTRSMELIVFGAPTFIRVPEKLVTVPHFGAASLTIVISADPEPGILWTFNSEVLGRSTGAELTTIYKIGSPIESNLRIQNFTAHNSGYFGLLVFNKHGVTYSETFVSVC